MIGIESEIAPLKQVIVSSPGPALERVIPENTQRYLFDDLLYTDLAIEEHE